MTNHHLISGLLAETVTNLPHTETIGVLSGLEHSSSTLYDTKQLEEISFQLEIAFNNWETTNAHNLASHEVESTFRRIRAIPDLPARNDKLTAVAA